MKRILISLIILSISTVASAQKLHNYPGKDSYNSPSEYPWISAQEHWRIFAGRLVPDNTCVLAATDDLTCAHIHNDLQCPYLAELNLNDTVTCNFSITLHHFPGFVTQIYPGFLHYPVVNIIWDATGNSNPPSMIGDPLGDLIFTGHFTTPLPMNSKGWWFLTNEIKFHLNDGTEGSPELLVPIWSNLNPTNADFSYHLPALRAASNLAPSNKWGQLTIEYDDYIPLLPISTIWETSLAFYSYGRPNLISGPDEVHVDMDLHHENKGRTIFSTNRAEDLGIPWIFDPAVLGVGPHKVAALRVQPDGDEQLTTILVINVTVDPNAPPTPTICTDPTAINFRGALPCVYSNPPPPVIDWHLISGIIQRLNDTIRICDVDNKCTDPMVIH